jgi:hypothetical protein
MHNALRYCDTKRTEYYCVTNRLDVCTFRITAIAVVSMDIQIKNVTMGFKQMCVCVNVFCIQRVISQDEKSPWDLFKLLLLLLLLPCADYQRMSS